jgi:hypothetical protein
MAAVKRSGSPGRRGFFQAIFEFRIAWQAFSISVPISKDKTNSDGKVHNYLDKAPVWFHHFKIFLFKLKIGRIH